MKTLYTAAALLVLIINPLRAQHNHDGDHESDHEHEYSHEFKPSMISGAYHYSSGHHHDRNEIGVSVGALYGLDDKEWGTGVHMHYFRTLGDHSPWAVGGFAEHAWLDNTHFSAGAGVRYEPFHRLSFGVFPGITAAKHSHEHNGHRHNEGWKTRFSMHFEVVCDLFYWRHFHLGPALDFSWTKNDSHFMLGMHGAFCF